VASLVFCTCPCCAAVLRGALVALTALPHNAALIVQLHRLKYDCLEAHTIWARS
jgi:hypothetical protein